jgi:hypothetical protein
MMKLADFMRCLKTVHLSDLLAVRNLNGRDHLEDLSVDGRTLEWILGNKVRCKLDSSASG